MSSVMAYFLLWIMLVHKQECDLIRMDQRNRNAYEYIVQKYMKPLQKLSVDLPNHVIEMEIEFHGTVPRATQNPQRRVIRLLNQYKPKPNLRSPQGLGDVKPPAPPPPGALRITTEIEPDPETGPPTPPAPTPGPPAPTPGPPAPTPEPPAPPSPKTTSTTTPAADQETESPTPPAPPPEPSKIPVYMEDLQKALDELEKKLATSTTCNPNTVPGSSVRSIDDIVQMLKKGVHVERRMPKVGDENLDWVQIKIPKKMRL